MQYVLGAKPIDDISGIYSAGTSVRILAIHFTPYLLSSYHSQPGWPNKGEEGEKESLHNVHVRGY